MLQPLDDNLPPFSCLSLLLSSLGRCFVIITFCRTYYSSFFWCSNFTLCISLWTSNSHMNKRLHISWTSWRARGAMDNASDYGSEDSRFESWRARYFFSWFYFYFCFFNTTLTLVQTYQHFFHSPCITSQTSNKMSQKQTSFLFLSLTEEILKRTTTKQSIISIRLMTVF